LGLPVVGFQCTSIILMTIVVDVRRSSRLDWMRILLSVSVVTGVTAWFLPRPGDVFAAVAALSLAIIPVVNRLFRTTGSASIVEAELVRRDVDRIKAESEAPDAGRDLAAMRDTFTRIARRFWAIGALLAAAGAIRQTLPLSNTRRMIAAQQEQLRGQKRLLDEISRLNSQVLRLNTAILEIDQKAQRDNRISFWAGVAISIPIGVLINLAT
jgi:hypothetical protein